MDETRVTKRPAGVAAVQALEPEFISVPDAGKYLGGIVPREIYRLIDRGEVEAVYHGRRRLITVASLRAYADRIKEAARQSRVNAA